MHSLSSRLFFNLHCYSLFSPFEINKQNRITISAFTTIYPNLNAFASSYMKFNLKLKKAWSQIHYRRYSVTCRVLFEEPPPELPPLPPITGYLSCAPSISSLRSRPFVRRCSDGSLGRSLGWGPLHAPSNLSYCYLQRLIKGTL